MIRYVFSDADMPALARFVGMVLLPGMPNVPSDLARRWTTPDAFTDHLIELYYSLPRAQRRSMLAYLRPGVQKFTNAWTMAKKAAGVYIRRQVHHSTEKDAETYRRNAEVMDPALFLAVQRFYLQ